MAGVWSMGFMFAFGVALSQEHLITIWDWKDWAPIAAVMLVSWPFWLGVWLGDSR